MYGMENPIFVGLFLAIFCSQHFETGPGGAK